MNSPASNVPYNLTVAKAKAPELPTDYEPLGPVEPIKAAFKGKAPAKRKRGDMDGEEDGGEDKMDEVSDDDGSGSGSQ